MKTRLIGALTALLLACDPAGSSGGPGSGIQLGSGSRVPGVSTLELTGGTVITANDGRFAVVSDSERDRLWVVDLVQGTLRGKLDLERGSRPGRMVADDRGRLRIALRGTGEVITFSPSGVRIEGRVGVCAEPRGLAWNTAAHALEVACASGELVQLPDTGAAVVTQTGLELRDVVLTGTQRRVTTFRASELRQLTPAGQTMETATPPDIGLPPVDGKPTSFVPHVAWRTVPMPNGDVAMVHQRHVQGDIASIQVPAAPPAPAYYGNTCASAVVRSALTIFHDGKTLGSVELGGVLPVDLAVSPDGKRVAVASAGSGTVSVLNADQLGFISGGICGARVTPTSFEPVGVAFTPQGDLVVHDREPAQLRVFDPDQKLTATILLSGEPPNAPGYTLFHNGGRGTGAAVACASCHPEGREDGHVWTFTGAKGPVRTQTVAGGINDTAPFHWAGNLKSIDAVVEETLVGRMGHPVPGDATVASLKSWMQAIPAPRTAAGAPAEAISHGKELFNDTAVGCASCHTGPQFTNGASSDVGTGDKFQVPSLRGVGARGPWMHDGCATTLRARFGTCGGGDKHGKTSQLTPEDLDALTAYLQTL